ncbi:YcgN family cysteine cluster protein [Kordiimonas sp. SCSIO 12603]|uniref:YcgN family cysteine cluster protein n=1 Tax=Kordiimonas sp. SCSIO 12603 TaxID=2829596 RepID=UPI002105174E|nr:YcgN family cysteine cluster protein [Kordiimonas sp. SCSIO 12603]UTW58655.1 YcgN family cysteine cluster protein [Kordiimonas sp. SCSIO 12603]
MSFWKEKALSEMSRDEWESLCDGCGKCCLHKLEDEDTGEIHHTDVACRFLDPVKITCGKYLTRQRYVGNCVVMSPDLLDTLPWMPSTCAYRLLHEGKDLYDWHPLVSGDRESVHKAGQSVRGKAVDEREAGDFEDHLVEWPA